MSSEFSWLFLHVSFGFPGNAMTQNQTNFAANPIKCLVIVELFMVRAIRLKTAGRCRLLNSSTNVEQSYGNFSNLLPVSVISIRVLAASAVSRLAISKQCSS